MMRCVHILRVPKRSLRYRNDLTNTVTDIDGVTGSRLRPFKTFQVLGAAIAATLALAVFSAPSVEAARRTPTKFAITASVERTSAVLDDEFTLTLRVDGVYEDFIDPPLGPFEVVERYSKTRNVLRDGRSDSFHEIAFRLRPQRIGELEIGAAQMKVGGKVVAKSTPVVITVSNPPPPSTAAQARKLGSFATQRAFLHATTAKDSYAVGEPFILQWDLYYKPTITYTPLNVHTRPSLGGAAQIVTPRETLLKPGQPERVTIDGKVYFKVAYSRQLVVAKAPVETLVVDPLKVNVNVEDRFSKARLRSNAYTLRIRSLPAAKRPDWFRDGNVGRFDMKATWQYQAGDGDGVPTTVFPNRMVADDLIILDVEISGTGNLNGIAAPALDGAQRFEVVRLQPRATDVVKVSPNGVAGVRHFRFRLRPKAVGMYATPRLRFSFYDPATKAYETLTGKGRMVEVDQTMRPTLGGLTLDNPELNAARAEVGWPHVRVTYTIPVDKGLDVSPQVAFFYGENTRVGRIGLELGAEVRWNFWRDGAWSGALVPDPAILVVIPTRGGDDGAIGLRFGIPAVALGYQVSSTMSLNFGARIPFWMTLGPDPQIWLPVLADIGVEFQVHRTDDAIVNLATGISAGPSMCLNNCPGPSVELGLRAFVGGAIVW